MSAVKELTKHTVLAVTLIVTVHVHRTTYTRSYFTANRYKSDTADREDYD